MREGGGTAMTERKRLMTGQTFKQTLWFWTLLSRKTNLSVSLNQI